MVGLPGGVGPRCSVWVQRTRSSITTLAAAEEGGVPWHEHELLRHEFPDDLRLCGSISQAGEKGRYPEASTGQRVEG